MNRRGEEPENREEKLSAVPFFQGVGRNPAQEKQRNPGMSVF